MVDIDGDLLAQLERHHFDEAAFDHHRELLRTDAIGPGHNTITGELALPAATDVTTLAARGTAEHDRLSELGRRAISAGQVGAVILAGGMATRFGGVVKAAVECVDGWSFLEVKLADIAKTAADAGGQVPVFLMTSFATHDDIAAMAAAASTANVPVEAFTQTMSLRLTPGGELFRGADGKPSPYAPGHGDLGPSLRQSGCLERFVRGGGRVLLMSNVDNVAATLDPAVIGAHLDSNAAITVEAAPKEPGVVGGAPVVVDGKLQIVEGFRFPPDFDQDSLHLLNTNTFVFDAPRLDRDFPLTWFHVEKAVDDQRAVQFERLVGELTAFLDTQVLAVAADGADGRFQPAKDPDELDRRRPELRALLRSRNVI